MPQPLEDFVAGGTDNIIGRKSVAWRHGAHGRIGRIFVDEKMLARYMNGSIETENWEHEFQLGCAERRVGGGRSHRCRAGVVPTLSIGIQRHHLRFGVPMASALRSTSVNASAGSPDARETCSLHRSTNDPAREPAIHRAERLTALEASRNSHELFLVQLGVISLASTTGCGFL
jgi:hypothetical protein